MQPELDSRFQRCHLLYVCLDIQEYINRTRSIRKPERDFLFLSLKKPYNTASKDTLSRLVKQMLTSSGIDSIHFKPHLLGVNTCSSEEWHFSRFNL